MGFHGARDDQLQRGPSRPNCPHPLFITLLHMRDSLPRNVFCLRAHPHIAHIVARRDGLFDLVKALSPRRWLRESRGGRARFRSFSHGRFSCHGLPAAGVSRQSCVWRWPCSAVIGTSCQDRPRGNIAQAVCRCSATASPPDPASPHRRLNLRRGDQTAARHTKRPVLLPLEFTPIFRRAQRLSA